MQVPVFARLHAVPLHNNCPPLLHFRAPPPRPPGARAQTASFVAKTSGDNALLTSNAINFTTNNFLVDDEVWKRLAPISPAHNTVRPYICTTASPPPPTLTARFELPILQGFCLHMFCVLPALCIHDNVNTCGYTWTYMPFAWVPARPLAFLPPGPSVCGALFPEIGGQGRGCLCRRPSIGCKSGVLCA